MEAKERGEGRSPSHPNFRHSRAPGTSLTPRLSTITSKCHEALVLLRLRHHQVETTQATQREIDGKGQGRSEGLRTRADAE